jgi:LysM repeat protein
MTNRASAPVRALAAIALVGGFLALVVIIGSSLGGGEQSRSGKGPPAGQAKRKHGAGARRAPAAYVVQNGDTLSSIAHRTGVSVARIQALNPDVDPQILISGEKLRLR